MRVRVCVCVSLHACLSAQKDTEALKNINQGQGRKRRRSNRGDQPGTSQSITEHHRASHHSAFAGSRPELILNTHHVCRCVERERERERERGNERELHLYSDAHSYHGNLNNVTKLHLVRVCVCVCVSLSLSGQAQLHEGSFSLQMLNLWLYRHGSDRKDFLPFKRLSLLPKTLRTSLHLIIK